MNEKRKKRKDRSTFENEEKGIKTNEKMQILYKPRNMTMCKNTTKILQKEEQKP